MKKQKTSYFLVKPNRRSKKPITAKIEIPYEIKLASRLFLDEVFYCGNKLRLESEINQAIDNGNRNKFEELSKKYEPYTWE
ncbi:IDEAL domain-containing protein [Salirhabdus sp. Marseille-P4669]|uniref:IDEAL domain-containing protein n=1 Tax=Salirhabdus sp. Marseille-P4669 TaxID=2042310 RepID=UPI000C7BE612|nr:IDEAL domain-containing protein [Salirhabdus sp. Marseille-P4669]